MRSKVFTLGLLLVSVLLWSTVGFAEETAKATSSVPSGWSKGTKKNWVSTVPPGVAKKSSAEVKSAMKKTGKGMSKAGTAIKTEAVKVKNEVEKGAITTEQAAKKLGKKIKEKI